MATTDPRVTAYIEKSQPFARPILKYIRKAVHAGCAGVQETMKWGLPHFDYKGPMCGMAAFKTHCSLGFWKAKLLGVDTAKSQGGMGQFGCVTSITDLPSAPKLIALVKKAARLNDQGIKAPRVTKGPKAPLTIPPAFAAALKKHKKAQAAFKAFSPSHRREYIAWIAEAKQETTRERRIATALEWLSKGKSRNWKYQ